MAGLPEIKEEVVVKKEEEDVGTPLESEKQLGQQVKVEGKGGAAGGGGGGGGGKGKKKKGKK
jgi:hypothetical protein